MNDIHWDLIAVAVAVFIGVLVATFGKRAPAVPAPVVPGPSPTQQDQDKKDAEAEKKIDHAHDVLIVDITDQHDQAVAKNVEALEKKTETLEHDDDATNQALIDVGKQVRGGRA